MTGNVRLGAGSLEPVSLAKAGATVPETRGSDQSVKHEQSGRPQLLEKSAEDKSTADGTAAGKSTAGRANGAKEANPALASFLESNQAVTSMVAMSMQKEKEAASAVGGQSKASPAAAATDPFANAAWHAPGKRAEALKAKPVEAPAAANFSVGQNAALDRVVAKTIQAARSAGPTPAATPAPSKPALQPKTDALSKPGNASAQSAAAENLKVVDNDATLKGGSPAGDTKAPSDRIEPVPETKPVETPVETRPAETRPAETRPAEATRAEAKPAEAKPVEATRAEVKPAEAKPVEATRAEVKPAEAKPVEAKPAKEKPSPKIAKDTLRDVGTPKQKPLRPMEGGGGGGGGSGTRGGGGGSGGGRGSGGGGASSASPHLGQRYFDQNFREVLTKGLSRSRRNLVSVGIFSFFVNLLVLCIPVYLFQISDRVLTSRSVDTLVMLSVLVVGFLLVHVLLDMIRRFVLMRIAVDTEMRLGPSVLSAAARASQNGSNREYQTLGDLQQLRNFITGPVLLTIFDIPVIPIYMLAIYLIHPQLGYIVTCTGGILFIIALINQKLTAVPFGQANAYGTRANLQADAMSRNAQVINAMGMIPEGVQIWGRETMDSLKAQVVAQDRNVLMSAISKFIRLCTQIAMLGWGAWLALNSELTGGMLIAASIVGSRALAPIEGAIEGWRGFIQARSSYARIKTLLLNSPLNLERLRLPRAEGRVTVERVLYVPPPTKKVILNGISFHLEPGDSLAIVGASGSGKSTLGRMLVGSIVPTAGNVRLDHMDLRNWDPRQFGESVGYLPQDVQLFPATIKANISRMREDATDDQIFDAAETADVHEMISQFAAGYETLIGVDGAPLSGGQKQRIGLARAFYGDPRMVVLDEPNSNLDVPGERALARALMRAKAKDITVIAITQRPNLLKHVDKIMMLKEGTVQAFGPRDDMLEVMRKSTAALEGGGGSSLPSQNQPTS